MRFCGMIEKMNYNHLKALCKRKKKQKKLEAKLAASVMSNLYSADFNFYKCKVCGGWHVGKESKSN